MTKRLHIVLSFIFAVVIAVSALVFPTSIPLASAAETVVGAYEQQNIMQAPKKIPVKTQGRPLMILLPIIADTM